MIFDMRKFRCFLQFLGSARNALQVGPKAHKMLENTGFLGLFGEVFGASTEPKVAGSNPARCTLMVHPETEVRGCPSERRKNDIPLKRSGIAIVRLFEFVARIAFRAHSANRVRGGAKVVEGTADNQRSSKRLGRRTLQCVQLPIVTQRPMGVQHIAAPLFVKPLPRA